MVCPVHLPSATSCHDDHKQGVQEVISYLVAVFWGGEGGRGVLAAWYLGYRYSSITWSSTRSYAPFLFSVSAHSRNRTFPWTFMSCFAFFCCARGFCRTEMQNGRERWSRITSWSPTRSGRRPPSLLPLLVRLLLLRLLLLRLRQIQPHDIIRIKQSVLVAGLRCCYEPKASVGAHLRRCLQY